MPPSTGSSSRDDPLVPLLLNLSRPFGQLRLTGGAIFSFGERIFSLSTSDPLKDDFKFFLILLWDHLNLPAPTRSQLIMADWLQYGPRHLVIEAFRGIGKSWVTAAYVLWLLYCNPQLKIMVVSASKTRADDFSTFLLRLIEEVPWLAHLKPKENQRSSKISFDVGPAKADQSPSIKSVGITGQLTGSRADIIIADD